MQALKRIRTDGREDEVRCYKRREELSKAIHEYEMARLELSSAEMRREIAESQLEVLCRIEV